MQVYRRITAVVVHIRVTDNVRMVRVWNVIMTCRLSRTLQWVERVTAVLSDCYLADCIPANGHKRLVLTINRTMPGLQIRVTRLLQVYCLISDHASEHFRKFIIHTSVFKCQYCRINFFYQTHRWQLLSKHKSRLSHSILKAYIPEWLLVCKTQIKS